MDSETIRRRFVDYFVERGHLHLPGLPLVTNDPSVTTLFTIAGMQQMIPYFMGREKPSNPNMVTVQQTMRTDDIDEVGDNRHCTFFEMLGNFSVGEYFKLEAIAYTWDFLVNTLGIPAERWWAVTYPGDDEARQAWLEVGIPAERIGETPQNFWGPPGGIEGPCGPNSEIHYDRGLEYSCGRADCNPANECCDRFVEIWNDVFMQFYQEPGGERRPLPWNNVDTGMGFERLAAVVQGVETIYETDLYQRIISAVTASGGPGYGQHDRIDRSLRIIADHARAVTFIANAGVMPSSTGRGYVLRRLLRRAALHGKLLGIDRPFLSVPVQAVIELMGGFYTDLRERSGAILEIVEAEEQRFLETLSRGLVIFEEIAGRAEDNLSVITGADAFVLYDTHGFPLELTQELAAERGLVVDAEGFAGQLEQQVARAKQARTTHNIAVSTDAYAALADAIPASVFTGYDELRRTTTVLAVLVGGQPVERADEGDDVAIILARTPFYAESGGQVGDTGVIRGEQGEARIADTQRPYSPFIVHMGRIESGSIAVGDVVEAEVDTERRLHVLPHHSATHLLHKALHEVLGPQATQAGSLVAPDRLRFDFRWSRAVTEDELREVEDRVNAAIWANLPVHKDVMPYEEAVRDGAMALFGEKYGDEVRVVSMGDWSKELCGGTHVEATGDIGLFVITSESSIGSGIRRIEALAGAAAYHYLNNLRAELAAIGDALETRPENLLTRVSQIVTQNREHERRIEALTRRLADSEADSLASGAEVLDGFKVVANRISADSLDYLQAATDAVRSRLERGIVVLGTLVESKPSFAMAVTKNLAEQGFSARDILRSAAKEAGGGAGGTSEFAQGGGRDASKVDDVIRTAVDLIRQKAEG